MRIEDWFDIHNIEHIKAYKHLQEHGVWPENFIPDNIEFSSIWQITLLNMFAKVFINLMLSEVANKDSSLPYIYKTNTEINRYWNPDYDQDKECKCGHPYHRHFDGYDDNEAVGCKYCDCYTFEPKE